MSTLKERNPLVEVQTPVFSKGVLFSSGWVLWAFVGAAEGAADE